MHIEFIVNVCEGQNQFNSHPRVLYRQCMAIIFCSYCFLNFEKTTYVQTMFRKKYPIRLGVISIESCIQTLQTVPVSYNTMHLSLSPPDQSVWV